MVLFSIRAFHLQGDASVSIFLNTFLFVSSWLCWLFVATRRLFSSPGDRGLLPDRSVQASLCVVEHRPGIRLCIAGQILTQRSTREALEML